MPKISGVIPVAVGSEPTRQPIEPPPPLRRDPWAWISAAAVLPVVLHSLGAPLGEPVAEDFDSLHHVLLLGQSSLLDGGGSTAFWRPLANQIYYLALGPLILTHPRVVAAIHVALLATCALLLYRALRRWWPGPWAAAAASFPLLSESTRALISWPSHFADVGALLFAALAIHEASRQRMTTSLLALLASLLCKEVGVVAATLIPLLPGIGSRKIRVRWALAIAVTTAGWAIAYLMVRQHAGLALPHHLEDGLRTMAVSPQTRFAWAAQNSVRAIASLPAAGVAWEGAYGIAWLALAIGVGSRLAASARARASLRLTDPWVLWGLSWFLLASATLTFVYPLWAPNRSVFGALGLGIGIVGLVGASHPVLLAALVVLRLVGFALSPGPPPNIAITAPATGASVDFERLARLQRLMAEIRETLHARFPTLPPGARVGQSYFPRSAVYALGGDRALQVWYRDTTLRWLTSEAYEHHSDPRLRIIVQYQPHQSPPIALVDSEAMYSLLRGMRRISDDDWPAALAEFARAESLQSDPHATVFRATVAAKQAMCLMALGDRARGVQEAKRALALFANTFDARYVLASEAFETGRLAEAESRLDTLLHVSPGDPGVLKLLERVRAAQDRGP